MARWLPAVRSEPPQEVSEEEIERLVRQLDDESYAVRVGALERLQWMAGSERLVKPIMLVVKRRLSEPSLSDDTYVRVDSVRNIAWGTWLNSDANDWDLPVSSAQIEKWLDALQQPVLPSHRRGAIGRRVARQELLDVLRRTGRHGA